jgi:hypothetical protein
MLLLFTVQLNRYCRSPYRSAPVNVFASCMISFSNSGNTSVNNTHTHKGSEITCNAGFTTLKTILEAAHWLTYNITMAQNVDSEDLRGLGKINSSRLLKYHKNITAYTHTLTLYNDDLYLAEWPPRKTIQGPMSVVHMAFFCRNTIQWWLVLGWVTTKKDHMLVKPQLSIHGGRVAKAFACNAWGERFATHLWWYFKDLFFELKQFPAWRDSKWSVWYCRNQLLPVISGVCVVLQESTVTCDLRGLRGTAGINCHLWSQGNNR